MSSKQMKRLRKALKYQNEKNNGMPEKQYFSLVSKVEKNEDGSGKYCGIISDEKRRAYQIAKTYLNNKKIKLKLVDEDIVEENNNDCSCKTKCENCKCN